MIGNDIIDLNLAKIENNWKRKGFLEKQFTDFEINEILNSENPFITIWLFWSMKEAAYKCYVQQYKKRFFAPKKFDCKIVSKSKGVVKIESNVYNINYLISDNYIHSLAFKKGSEKMVSNLFFIENDNCQSKITNQSLLSNFQNDFQLEKNEWGVPYLMQQQRKLPISISTSHHGNYGGYAILN